MRTLLLTGRSNPAFQDGNKVRMRSRSASGYEEYSMYDALKLSNPLSIYPVALQWTISVESTELRHCKDCGRLAYTHSNFQL